LSYKSQAERLLLETKIRELTSIYRRVRIDLLAQLARIDLTEAAQIKTQAILSQVDAIIKGLNKKAYSWVKEEISKSYYSGVDIAGEILKKYRVTSKVNIHSAIHTQAINVLVDDIVVDLIYANGSIKKSFSRLLMTTQQRVLEDRAISRMIAEGAIEGQARRAVSDRILNEFKNRLGEGKFIEINGRNYSPDKYAELVARTRMSEASNAGLKNTALDYGLDLVQWDTHSEICELCQQYAGRIYSISGNDKDFPKLEEEPPLHPNCYDKDSEIYTERGWINVKDINIDDKCLSLNLSTLIPEYSAIDKLIKNYEKNMVSFKNRVLDLLVTPQHEMVYATDWNHKHNRGKLILVKADSLIGKSSGSFYRSSEWKGTNPEIRNLGGKDINFRLYAEFMGWYLSEGCLITGRNSISISQSKKVNYDKYCRIDELLSKIGLRYRKNDYSFSLYNPSLYRELKIYGKSFEKFIPKDIKNSSSEIIRIFLDAFLLGDGHRRQGNGWKKAIFREERIYFTSSKRMADDIGELILKIGRRPSFYLENSKGKICKFRNGEYAINNNLWIIRECYSQYASLSNMEIKKVAYNDLVYCVELKKNHTLWVRRNGKTVWCGNCKCHIYPITEQAIEDRYASAKLSNSKLIKINSYKAYEEALAAV